MKELSDKILHFDGKLSDQQNRKTLRKHLKRFKFTFCLDKKEKY